MKKCPYCAEDIQDAAVKCRFCGEWIRKNENTMQNGNGTHSFENVDKCSDIPDDDASNLAVTMPCNDSDTEKESNGISQKVAYFPLYHKPKWGWGWVLLLSLTIPGFKLLLSYDSTIAFFIMLFGSISVIVFYFWVRTKIAKREKYVVFSNLNRKQMWLPSFHAGLLAYCLSVLLVGVGSFFGTIQENKKHSEFFKKLEIRGGQLRDREIEIIKAMVIDPKSEEDRSKNLKCVNDILLLENQKYNFIQEFAAYIADVGKRKEDQSLLTNVARLKKLSDKKYDLCKSYANKLIEYDNSGDEALLEASEEIMADLIKVGNEISQATDNIYNFFEKKRNAQHHNATDKPQPAASAFR